MTISIDALREELSGRQLPGGSITIERYEAVISDGALRAAGEESVDAHPAWFIFASLRCMGITVDELCAWARQRDGDTLLFGRCRIDQHEPLRVGSTYRAVARIASVDSRTTREGARLDSVEVVVDLTRADAGDRMDGTGAADAAPAGSVTSVYLFKRVADPTSAPSGAEERA